MDRLWIFYEATCVMFSLFFLKPEWHDMDHQINQMIVASRISAKPPSDRKVIAMLLRSWSSASSSSWLNGWRSSLCCDLHPIFLLDISAWAKSFIASEEIVFACISTLPGLVIDEKLSQKHYGLGCKWNLIQQQSNQRKPYFEKISNSWFKCGLEAPRCGNTFRWAFILNCFIRVNP